MKKINNFFDKSPLWQVYIFGWAFFSLCTFTLFEWVEFKNIINGKVLPTVVNLKIGATGGILFGLMFVLMISMNRKSNKFKN